MKYFYTAFQAAFQRHGVVVSDEPLQSKYLDGGYNEHFTVDIAKPFRTQAEAEKAAGKLEPLNRSVFIVFLRRDDSRDLVFGNYTKDRK